MKKMIAAMVVATLGMSTAAVAQTTPPAPAGGSLNGVLAGTGLTAGAAAGILGALILVGIAVSDDDNSSTTTSTK